MEDSKVVIQIPKKEQELGKDLTIKYPYKEIKLSINNETKTFETPESNLAAAKMQFEYLEKTLLTFNQKFEIIKKIIEICEIDPIYNYYYLNYFSKSL